MSSDFHRNALLDTWTRTSSHVFNSVMAANRAAFAAFGVRPSDGEGGLETVERIEADEDLPEWHVELTTTDRSRLGVGDRVEFTKTISKDDVAAFAAATGLPEPPATTVARLAIGSAARTTWLHLAGYVVAAVVVAVAVRRYAGAVSPERFG